GLGAGWTQNVFNAQKATVIDAPSDVTLTSSKQKANGFDSEFGAMYMGQKFKAGFSVLHLYNTNPTFVAGDYKLLPQSNINVSYTFNKGKKVELEPWLVDRFTLKGTNVIEGLLNVNFLKMLTVGAGYRSNYGVLGFIGVKAKNLKVAYSFDYGISKNATSLGGSHQILVGFILCKAAKEIPKTIPEPITTQTKAPEPVKEEPKQIDQEEKKEAVVVKETPKEEMKIEAKKETHEETIKQANQLAEKIIFALGKSTLDQNVLSKLDEVAKLMKENPTMKINIIGHACKIGDAESNKILSEQRAAYVKNQLVNRGVNNKNINTIIGAGSENELYNNDEANQSKNRTVRFELVK
ncbi:MAG TPA: type IX secretion system membrane protein PorP/SprF, partial [Bacteroidia bacterium]|nr:type IX secretion system membrane protein PorP/SprF [Bacteroidia bacterium]